MNKAEALTLCRFTKACCPQQTFDDYSPDAWFELLGDLRFADCKLAVIEVAKTQPFVAPAEVRAMVRRIRNDRVRAFGPYNVPSGLEAGEYHALIVETTRRIADGDLTDPSELALPNGEPRPAIEWAGMFHSVNEAVGDA